MKKILFLLIVLFVAGCGKEASTSYLTPEKALEYFNSIEAICNKDNGSLWGENLFGPIMFIEGSTRHIIANHSDAEGILKKEHGVYTGIYPRELMISNAPVRFGGSTFAMVPLPTEEDPLRIKNRTVHVLFHCFQLRKGLEPALFNQRNMDEKEARFYVKLEWKALRKAIENEGEERLVAIRDALVFRGARTELFQAFASESNHFESYEGFATFTSTMLCAESPVEFKERLIKYLDLVYSMASYARSYGNIHGALYATLLYDACLEMEPFIKDCTDLGKLVKETYMIELPAICRDVAGSLALGYDLDVITREEEERYTVIKEQLHRLTSTFTEKAVVYLELESPYFDFEPEDVHPLDTLGTLYKSMRVSDSWGKLTVNKGGCLVSRNYKYLRITAKGYKAEKNRITGEDWNLVLNEGWELVPVNQNYFLRKMTPL